MSGTAAGLRSSWTRRALDLSPSSPHYGRIYVSFTGFGGDAKRTQRSPIVLSYSDDGGYTWSVPNEISGFSAQYCTFQTSGPAGECDEDQFSYPVTTPDGTVYVAFQNGQHEAAWEAGEQFENQYLVVRSADGGVSFAPPVHVADLEDGTRDFPQNADGRPTLTGMQPRVPSGGNIAASPTDGRLYITFTDNRLGSHDVAVPVTKARVFVTSSVDGATWTTPTPINDVTGATSDQWFPWADVAPDGTLGVIYNQRTGTNTHAVDLAEGAPGAFTTTRLTTADSDVNNSLYFQAGVPECMLCTVFHGDYLALDYGSDGAANGAWTDMRDVDADTGLHLQFVYYARR